MADRPAPVGRPPAGPLRQGVRGTNVTAGYGQVMAASPLPGRSPTVALAVVGGPALPVTRAGGLVVAGDGRVAVVHRPRRDDWTFPKGRVEPGETAERCARREVREETGYRCRPVAFAGHVLQPRRRDGRPRLVAYWVMHPTAGRFRPSHEVDELRWLDLAEATALLTHEHDRHLLERALPPPTALAR